MFWRTPRPILACSNKPRGKFNGASLRLPPSATWVSEASWKASPTSYPTALWRNKIYSPDYNMRSKPPSRQMLPLNVNIFEHKYQFVPSYLGLQDAKYQLSHNYNTCETSVYCNNNTKLNSYFKKKVASADSCNRNTTLAGFCIKISNGMKKKHVWPELLIKLQQN